jgi:integrase
MTKTNAANERIKREYSRFLREAHGRDDTTIDRIAKSLARFEASTKARDFKRFHREQAVALKAKLAEATSARTGEKLSKATLLATLRDLRAFFLWLAREPGYKSAIAYAGADYFNLPDKDVAIAQARRERPVPSLDQVRHVIACMPSDTVLNRRDRALIAFSMITCARIGALASFRLGHVDVAGGFVDQDARTVRPFDVGAPCHVTQRDAGNVGVVVDESGPRSCHDDADKLREGARPSPGRTDPGECRAAS